MSRTGWFWVAAVAALLIGRDHRGSPSAWCRAGPRWAAGTTPRPTRAGRRRAVPEERENLDLWKAMDEGRDPTA